MQSVKIEEKNNLSEELNSSESPERKRRRLNNNLSTTSSMEKQSAKQTPHKSQNGDSKQNNHHTTSKHQAISQLTPRGFQRNQLIRLMSQELYDLGFSKIAQALEDESGVQLHNKAINDFRENILEAKWDTVLQQLPHIQFKENTDLKEIQFLIIEQKYMELLEAKDIHNALICVRTELAPLNCKQDRLHRLSLALLCKDSEELKQKVGWDGNCKQSRQKLLTEIQQYIPSSVFVPENRLEHLLLLSMKSQISECVFHNTNTGGENIHNNNNNQEWDLLSDHKCESDGVPHNILHVLEEHTDEVWCLAYSPNGKFLAAGSKDGAIAIWNVSENDYKIAHRFTAHQGSVAFVSFSPDSQLFLSGGSDGALRLFDPQNGTAVRTFSVHSNSVTCGAWLPDNLHFVSGSVDKTMILMDINGHESHKWTDIPVHDLKISLDGSLLIVLPFEKHILIYDLNKLEEKEVKIESEGLMTSIDLSKDSSNILVNMNDSGKIHIFDLENRKICKTLQSHIQKKFVIRSAFGGMSSTFVASGSEDAKVYVWNHKVGTLLSTLEGHYGIVNAVCWNPVVSGVLASASDDHTIRIWGNVKRSRVQPE